MASTTEKEEGNRFINILYDIITILISIADISTDVIVLISFYIEGRTTLFVISLIILIMAQLCYAVAFIWRYEVFDDSNIWVIIFVFCCLLPIGWIVSFIFYFTDDEDSWCSTQFYKIKRSQWTIDCSFKNNMLHKNQSAMTRWIITKLSKHMGFIIEAGIEALPQSLLQIIAIVYYNEANYIAIVSIFLSMFSVMTKSLVFSQGIDIKTYIWTWLCIVVDFFGIFFILSWVFYTNDSTVLQPQFMGYFTVIGEIWFYKVMISVTPCILLGLLWFVITYLPQPMHELCTRNQYGECDELWTRIGWIILLLVGGTIFLFVVSCVCFIAIEIFCFSFLALGLYVLSTLRWDGYEERNVSEKLNGVIRFISNSSCFNMNRDRMLRVLAVSSCIVTDIKTYDWQTMGPNKATREYIAKIERESGIKGLKKIKYSDLRNTCGKPEDVRYANLFLDLWDEIKKGKPTKNDISDCRKCIGHDWEQKAWNCTYVIGYYLCFIALPVFTICKILQVLFPYVILGYLLYNDELLNVDLFQLVMLFTFIGLQLILVLLGISVCKIHWWLWHIYVCNIRYIDL